MKKDVTINIKGTYNFEDDQADVVELFTTGEFYRKNGSYYISYEESEVTGFSGSRTTLKVEDQNCVTMSRKGADRELTQLIVQNGVRHQCQYDIGFGDMMIGVSGRSISSTLNDRGGKLEFKYSLDINSLFASDNEMLIIVRED
jgi:uncharacterized beta-barrel protein YwiB (DUF1934 family)